ncbi:hypothetical protein ACFWB2_34690 [Streptomyces virginiae]|uniref:hypothetical protein n=1 Tax=Streptomyces virginiae TaxID=1961 RepID=UPI0036AE3A3D
MKIKSKRYLEVAGAALLSLVAIGLSGSPASALPAGQIDVSANKTDHTCNGPGTYLWKMRIAGYGNTIAEAQGLAEKDASLAMGIAELYSAIDFDNPHNRVGSHEQVWSGAMYPALMTEDQKATNGIGSSGVAWKPGSSAPWVFMIVHNVCVGVTPVST